MRQHCEPGVDHGLRQLSKGWASRKFLLSPSAGDLRFSLCGRSLPPGIGCPPALLTLPAAISLRWGGIFILRNFPIFCCNNSVDSTALASTADWYEFLSAAFVLNLNASSEVDFYHVAYYFAPFSSRQWRSQLQTRILGSMHTCTGLVAGSLDDALRFAFDCLGMASAGLVAHYYCLQARSLHGGCLIGYWFAFHRRQLWAVFEVLLWCCCAPFVSVVVCNSRVFLAMWSLRNKMAYTYPVLYLYNVFQHGTGTDTEHYACTSMHVILLHRLAIVKESCLWPTDSRATRPPGPGIFILRIFPICCCNNSLDSTALASTADWYEFLSAAFVLNLNASSEVDFYHVAYYFAPFSSRQWRSQLQTRILGSMHTCTGLVAGSLDDALRFAFDCLGMASAGLVAHYYCLQARSLHGGCLIGYWFAFHRRQLWAVFEVLLWCCCAPFVSVVVCNSRVFLAMWSLRNKMAYTYPVLYLYNVFQHGTGTDTEHYACTSMHVILLHRLAIVKESCLWPTDSRGFVLIILFAACARVRSLSDGCPFVASSVERLPRPATLRETHGGIQTAAGDEDSPLLADISSHRAVSFVSRCRVQSRQVFRSN